MASDFEINVMNKLAEIHNELGKNTAMTEALGGEHGRVTVLEEKSKTHEQRQWIHSLVIVPAMASIHAILRHFRIDV